MLQNMVASAQSAKILLLGRPACRRIGRVVDVAVPGEVAASGEPAPLIAGSQPPPQFGGWSISIDREDGAGDRMREHAVPAGSVSSEAASGGRVDRSTAVEFGARPVDAQ